ncbi:hypothetical protein [Escherichia coli]|uniref:hypothetical protein n=1 Tax=Escherichia coli TaxID=562 RepID=UPI001C4049A5|nr:hypothetical protein [Escherichia coli]
MSESLSILSTIVSGVSAIASGVVSIYENGAKLLEIMKVAIAKVEAAYESLKAAGATKKALVLATLKAAAEALGEAWENIVSYFSALIDSVVDLYNTAVVAISGTTGVDVAAEAD